MSSRTATVAAAVVSSHQRSAEMFAEARKTQHLLEKDFECHDERQELFKQRFLKETRKHHQCICDAACAASGAMSAAASSALLFAQHNVSSSDALDTVVADHDDEIKEELQTSLNRLRASARGERGQDQTHIWNGLKSFYTPPDAATGVICDACFGFRSAAFAQELPTPWQEFVYENDPKKHYYYHPETKKVLWHPPPGASALSRLVFERTNSVFTVCRCRPSHERRRRLMQKFRGHAQEMAEAEAKKREQQLRGAFSSLAISLMNTESQ